MPAATYSGSGTRSAVAWTPDGQWQLTATSPDFTIAKQLSREDQRSWLIFQDLSGIQVRRQHVGFARFTLSYEPFTAFLYGAPIPVNDFYWSPDAARLVSVSDNGTAILWDLATRKAIFRAGHMDWFVWSLDSTLVAALDAEQRTWTIIDATSGAVHDTLPAPGEDENYLVWSPDSQRIAQVCDGVITVWER